MIEFKDVVKVFEDGTRVVDNLSLTIEEGELVVLEDDLSFFPPYDASPVVNAKMLEDYPELENILLKLEEQISPEQMQELNYIADDMLIEPAIVAQKFLEANNYFENVEPYVEVQGGQNNGIID